MAVAWTAEVYLKGPNGETGYDIECSWVIDAKSKEQAIRHLKSHYGKKFDVIISLYEAVLCDLGPRVKIIRGF